VEVIGPTPHGSEHVLVRCLYTCDLVSHGCSCDDDHDDADQIRSDQSKHLQRIRRRLSICTGEGDIPRADADLASAHYKVSTIRTHTLNLPSNQIHQTSMIHFTL
jgi:hypothetical protein